MACCTLYFHSPALMKACSMTVIVPESGVGEPPFPVCYLLHGLSDDHTSWARRTSIERYVANLPLIVVMPDGGRGFYTDAVEGPAYERHLIEDVIGFVDRTFQTIRVRRGRVIGGLSMGGFGAMKLALKFPQLFCQRRRAFCSVRCPAAGGTPGDGSGDAAYLRPLAGRRPQRSVCARSADRSAVPARAADRLRERG